MMKNFFMVVTYVAALCCVSGCKQKEEAGSAEGKIRVTAVIFAPYDFVRELAGDRVNLAMLLPSGSESHSFEPSPRDIIAIQNSDVFIYVGGESDQWVDRILNSLDPVRRAAMKILRLMDTVDAVEEEIVEGMETEDGDEGAYDEHVWTSPKNARLIVRALAEILGEADGKNGDFYRQNAEEYTAKLDELDRAFRLAVEGGRRKTIVFGDRFPFRYLADAYGLSYYAAFPGCSTETEPSAATVAFLINKARSEGIPVIFHLELSNERMADTIAEAVGAKKLLFHACHNISKKDFENGVTYLDLMKMNLEHLQEALK